MFGNGVHEMVLAGDNTEPIQTWGLQVAEYGRQGVAKHLVFMGIHSRIIELAPVPYREYARGPQGNAKIKLWNSIMLEVSNSTGMFSAVDPFFITDQLDISYRDSEDGMHMGFWVNLQKVQLVLQDIRKMKL